MPETLISISELSKRFKISPSTIRRLIGSGKLASQKVGGQWRFDPEAVSDAFKQGLLAGGEQKTASQGYYATPMVMLDWAQDFLKRWKTAITNYIRKTQPDHVIVNDRRGAKVWSIIMGDEYSWGDTLWHGTAVKLMDFNEFKKIFGRKRILLFDEMMQSGRQVHDLRMYFEKVGAEVFSFVCVRRRKRAEEARIAEFGAEICEDLDESKFKKRAEDISRLMNFVVAPLDVDHIVVKGKLGKEFNDGLDIIRNLSRWGLVSVVRYPDKMNSFFALTLDRPQFFDTQSINWQNSFSINWKGPLKVRLYIDPKTGDCYLSFIAYPELQGPISSWTKIETGEIDGDLLGEKTSEFFYRSYIHICTDLAIQLLSNFISSGAINDLGVHFDDLQTSIDKSQLRATFGGVAGNKIYTRIGQILTLLNPSLFAQRPQKPLPLFVRDHGETVYSYDVFDCRTALLKAVPRHDSSTGTSLPISYDNLVHILAAYSESTIGKVLDYELDWGTIRPVVEVQFIADEVRVWRGFYRGEYGPWFEYESDLLSSEDRVVQRTFLIAPIVIENFIKRTGIKAMTSTHIAKIFSNLCHDWRPAYGKLYLGWRAYKYGAVAVAPKTNMYGQYESFEQFLANNQCLEMVPEPHKTKVWKTYKLPDKPAVNWKSAYEKNIDGATKYYVSGLARLYAAIKELDFPRPSWPGSSRIYDFGDPLVALATVRNERTAYRCGWFEVADWKEKGSALFSLLLNVAVGAGSCGEGALTPVFANFASPARLLIDKLEMYRTLPKLREQIRNLMNTGDFEAANVVLETVDETPVIRSEGNYPIKELEWAAHVMQSFSSLIRQLMTTCKLDKDLSEQRRTSLEGTAKDARFYLKQLIDSWSDIRVFQAELDSCIAETEKAGLTSRVAELLNKIFRLIAKTLEARLPDPRKDSENSLERIRRIEGLMMALRNIRKPDPYVVAVSDFFNVRNLLNISQFFGVRRVTAMDGLLQTLDDTVREIVQKYESVSFAGIVSDNLVFAATSPDQMFLAMTEIEKSLGSKLFDIDCRLELPGVFRTGFAWHDAKMGPEFADIDPGLKAYDLSERHKRAPGLITVTEEVFNRLSPDFQNRFEREDFQGRPVYSVNVTISRQNTSSVIQIKEGG